MQKCQTGDFKSAIPLLQFLVLANPQQRLYQKALAGSLHATHYYAEALACYQMVYQRGGAEEFECNFFAADCLFNLAEYNLCKNHLEQFLLHLKQQKVIEPFQLQRANRLLAAANHNLLLPNGR